MGAFDFLKRLFGGGGDDSNRRGKERIDAEEGTLVLVIDDSATIVAVLTKMLTTAGYLVSKGVDAESGIAAAREQRPDLIFLDIVLPGMNGFEALRVFRREPGTKDVPIIMISGNLHATEQYYAQRIGADAFMKKPFARAEVFARIEKLVTDGRLVRRGAAAAKHEAEK